MFTPFSISRLPAPLTAIALLLSACQPQPPAKPAAVDPAPQAQAPAPAMADAPAVPEVTAFPAAFAGRWFVSAVYPTGLARASIGDQHVGASLVIGPEEVSDVNGQRCVLPETAADRDAGNLRLGDVTLSDLERLTVTCKGKTFATYLLLPGRQIDASYQAADAPDVPYALLADRPEAQYLLERAEQVLHRQASIPAALAGDGRVVAPVSEPSPAAKPFVPEKKPESPAAPGLNAPLALTPEPPVPAETTVPSNTPVVEPQAEPTTQAAAKPAVEQPMVEKKVVEKKIEKTQPAAKPDVTAASGAALPAAGSAIHLASYQGISAAKRGWKTLLGEFDALDPLSPLYVDVDVAGKGQMVRLYATGGDKTTLQSACSALQAKGTYCVLAK